MLLAEHGGAVEADLQRFYAVDLRWLVDQRLTYRRLVVLLAHLPREAALVQALSGEAARWSVTDYLLAHAVDTLNVANWQRAQRKGLKRPDPVPRPGDKPRADRKQYKASRTYTSAQIDAMFGGVEDASSRGGPGVRLDHSDDQGVQGEAR